MSRFNLTVMSLGVKEKFENLKTGVLGKRFGIKDLQRSLNLYRFKTLKMRRFAAHSEQY
jgi:hypothetical protein